MAAAYADIYTAAGDNGSGSSPNRHFAYIYDCSQSDHLAYFSLSGCSQAEFASEGEKRVGSVTSGVQSTGWGLGRRKAPRNQKNVLKI